MSAPGRSETGDPYKIVPGAGAAQHLARLMGRGRALEVLLSAQDYDAELAERYGWPASGIVPHEGDKGHHRMRCPYLSLKSVRERSEVT